MKSVYICLQDSPWFVISGNLEKLTKRTFKSEFSFLGLRENEKFLPVSRHLVGLFLFEICFLFGLGWVVLVFLGGRGGGGRVEFLFNYH